MMQTEALRANSSSEQEFQPSQMDHAHQPVQSLLGSSHWLTRSFTQMLLMMLLDVHIPFPVRCPLWLCNLDPGAIEFRQLTKSNFYGVEVVDWPVTPPSNFSMPPSSHLMSSFPTQSLNF